MREKGGEGFDLEIKSIFNFTFPEYYAFIFSYCVYGNGWYECADQFQALQRFDDFSNPLSFAQIDNLRIFLYQLLP